MHELAITQSMFDVVLKHAEQAKAKKVTKINLVIGEMTGVVGDCVQFYLEFLAKNTVVEGATLAIRNVPAQAKCRTCGNTFEVQELQWICPDCGGSSLKVTGGKELFVESIEVE